MFTTRPLTRYEVGGTITLVAAIVGWSLLVYLKRRGASAGSLSRLAATVSLTKFMCGLIMISALPFAGGAAICMLGSLAWLNRAMHYQRLAEQEEALDTGVYISMHGEDVRREPSV